MGKKQRKSAQSVSDDSNNLSLNIRRTAVSLAVAAALPGAMMAPQVAMAQDDDDEVIEEIVSYGTYTASLASSMDAKRNNSSIIEAISAEDIGKLPDISIAESLARLPGVTVQRLNGRGQVVNIRGMSPDFSTGIMNGRPPGTARVLLDWYPRRSASTPCRSIRRSPTPIPNRSWSRRPSTHSGG